MQAINLKLNEEMQCGIKSNTSSNDLPMQHHLNIFVIIYKDLHKEKLLIKR